MLVKFNLDHKIVTLHFKGNEEDPVPTLYILLPVSIDYTSFVFQVAGIVDSILHNTIRVMKKVELGKNF
jgi:hypothetical protein